MNTFRALQATKRPLKPYVPADQRRELPPLERELHALLRDWPGHCEPTPNLHPSLGVLCDWRFS